MASRLWSATFAALIVLAAVVPLGQAASTASEPAAEFKPTNLLPKSFPEKAVEPRSPESVNRIVDVPQAASVGGAQKTPAILGGNPVASSQAPPSMVRLVMPGEPLGFCAGTLATAFIVVTAAHCVTDEAGAAMDPAGVGIIAGTSIRGSGGRRVAVAAIDVHPDYDPISIDADVAVLVLAKAQPGPYAQLALSEPAPGTVSRAYGWGLTAAGNSPLRLLSTPLSVIDRENCALAIGSINVVTDGMLCAGASGRGICSGDSGGPLFTGTFPNLVQVGVSSWGVTDVDGNCLTLAQGYPSVFANVAVYSDYLTPFLLRTSGLQVDLRQAWVLEGALEIYRGLELVDFCDVYLSVTGPEAACLDAPIGFVGRSPLVLLPPLPTGQAYTVLFQAYDSLAGIDLSPVVGMSSAVRPGGLTRVTLDPRPLVPVVQVRQDATYSFLGAATSSGDDVCTLSMYAPMDAYCEGLGELIGLAGNHVGVLATGGPPSLLFVGGGYANVFDPVVVTKVTALTPTFRPGVATAIAPALALANGFGGLDLRGARATEWEATVWPFQSGEPAAYCLMTATPAYNSADCTGSSAVVGLRSGKVAIGIDGALTFADVEALQVMAGVTTAAIAEGVLVAQGSFAARSLRFGPVALLG